MALVAYGSDSDSDGESGPASPQPLTFSRSSKNANNICSTPVRDPGPPLTEPPPRNKAKRIFVLPTLEKSNSSDEDGDDDERQAKRLKREQESKPSGLSGLLGMLPAPKNTKPKPTTVAKSTTSTSYAPRTVVARPSVPSTPSSLRIIPAGKTPASGLKLLVGSQAESDEESDDEINGPISFFPLGKAATATPASSSTSSLSSSLSKLSQPSNTHIPGATQEEPADDEEDDEESLDRIVYPNNDQYAYPSNDQYAYPSTESYAYENNGQYAYPGYDQSLENQHQHEQQQQHQQAANTFKLDQESRAIFGARKSRGEAIKVIDVRGQDQLNQAQYARQAMAAHTAAGGQSASKPVDLASISHLKTSAVMKRKHNIMSLAYEAKANQQQLNSAWAASRATKAETQSKYGF